MAIYHLSVSNVSRAAGSKATATLSYITGRAVHDETRGETYDYGRKERVLHVGTLLPEGAPAEWRDAARLFNAIEAHEKARTARPAKKIVVALPREFSAEQRVEAVESYIRQNLTADGYAAAYAIHEDKAGSNPHAHILVANRQIDPKTGDWAKLKQRMEYVLDERGERVPLIDPKTGEQKTDKRGRRQWKRRSVSLNPLDRKAKLEELREHWAETCNRMLPESARIDHRSLEAQGSDLEPTIHEGYAARAIERRGGVSERCETNREIRRGNALLTAIRDELRQITAKLGELFAAKISQLKALGERKQGRETVDTRTQSRPSPRDFIPAARRRLEAEREERVEGLRADLRSVIHRLDYRRDRLKYDDSDAWRQIVQPAINRVENAMDKAETAGFLARGKARRDLEATAMLEGAGLKEHAPWLDFGRIPTDRAGLNQWKADLREQDARHETKPLREQEARLRQAIETERYRPISRQEIEAVARSMAETAENGPQSAEQAKPLPQQPKTQTTPQTAPQRPEPAPSPAQPEPTPQQPQRRKTRADVLGAIKDAGTRRMDDQAEQEAERRIERIERIERLSQDEPEQYGTLEDPFGWGYGPDDGMGSPTHGLGR